MSNEAIKYIKFALVGLLVLALVDIFRGVPLVYIIVFLIGSAAFWYGYNKLEEK